MRPRSNASPTTVETNGLVTLNVISTFEVSPHSATMYPPRTTRPFRGARPVVGPMRWPNGSRAKAESSWARARSFGASGLARDGEIDRVLQPGGAHPHFFRGALLPIVAAGEVRLGRGGCGGGSGQHHR